MVVAGHRRIPYSQELVFRPLSTSSRSPKDINYFSILEVTRDSDLKAIKLAFYRKAKRLHPDVNRDLTLEEANAQFIRLKLAFDTLSDETKRLKYLNQIDNPISYSRNDMYQSDQHQQAYQQPHDDEFGFTAGRGGQAGHRSFKRKNRSMIPLLQNSWAQFQEDLEIALTKAYHGPLFTPDSEMEYPEAFEAEERSRPHSADSQVDRNVIVKLVSGRQLLGSVSVLHLDSDSNSDAHHDTCIASAGEEGGLFANIAPNTKLAERLRQHFRRIPETPTESIWQRIFGPSVDNVDNIAANDNRADKHDSTPTRPGPNQTRHDSTETLPVLARQVLELHWFGRRVARATRLVDTRCPSQSSIVFEVDSDHADRAAYGTATQSGTDASSGTSSGSSTGAAGACAAAGVSDAHTAGTGTGNAGMRVIAALLSSSTVAAASHARTQNVLLDGEGEETHAVINHATPGTALYCTALHCTAL